VTAAEALGVLEEALSRTEQVPHNTEAVRAALRALLPLISDKSWLSYFWTSAESDNAIGRHQNGSAALNGIKLRV
jgi:hypothetical protein